MHKYNRSDKWSTAQGKALGTKAPGTALDLILFLSAAERERDSEMEKVRGRYCARVLCVIPAHWRGFGGWGWGRWWGIMTVNLSVLVSAPMEKMDYASSCLFE